MMHAYLLVWYRRSATSYPGLLDQATSEDSEIPGVWGGIGRRFGFTVVGSWGPRTAVPVEIPMGHYGTELTDAQSMSLFVANGLMSSTGGEPGGSRSGGSTWVRGLLEVCSRRQS